MTKSECLPDPSHLRWSHSTCSQSHLAAAMEDEDITAIEVDVVMGARVKGEETVEQAVNDDDDNLWIPVMAHPPKRTSDLSMTDFLDQIIVSKDRTKELQKHIKLDFKELDVVEPTMAALRKRLAVAANHTSYSRKTVFLNADILPGPGMRHEEARIEPNSFLAACLGDNPDDEDENADEVENEAGNEDGDDEDGTDDDFCILENDFAFSLGWKVDCRAIGAYTPTDIDEMNDIIDQYNLEERSKGIVLAVNARVLSRNCAPFDPFLERRPRSQLLVWTGSGEPPISQGKIKLIQQHFRSKGTLDRVGFDCQVAGTMLGGRLYDSAVVAASLVWNVRKLVKKILNS